MEPNFETPKEPSKWSKSLLLLSGSLIFISGWGFGSGRIKINEFSRSVKTNLNERLPADLDYSSVETIYDSLKSQFDGKLDHQKLMQGLYSGLTKAAGDPYTEYLDPEAAKEFNQEIDGTFSGIGAELSKDNENNIIVIAPLDGYPAAQAGLKPKDIITHIDDKSAFDLTVSEAVKQIRGPENTTVKLSVVRDKKSVLQFNIKRQKISIPSLTYKIENGIAIIKISRFGDDTDDLMLAASQKIVDSSVKGIIVDVRGNPGGLLDASVNVAGYWLKKGTIVLSERRADVIVKNFDSSGPATFAGIKTIVLINEGSASASEILAGALKDHQIAELIGVQSFGKGSVQSLDKLMGGDILKITIARWYTPKGQNIDKSGLKPDIEVKRSDEDFKAGRDPQMDAAMQKLQQ